MYLCNTMETVFDHNITKEEMVAVMGLPTWTREELLSMGGTQEELWHNL